ncbi:MAG TPA: tetratricopeptide repeat protein [Thermoanaerobaculia bacterium]
MKRASIILVVVAAFSTVGLAQSISNQGYNTADAQTIKRMKDVNPHLVKARDQVAKHDFAGARKTLEDILEKVPELSEAHFLMAKVLYAEKNWTESLASMERAEQTLGSLATMMMKMNEDRRKALIERRRAQEAVIADLKGRPQPLPLAQQSQLDRAEQLRGEIDRSLNELNEPQKSTVPAEYPFFHGNILLRMQKFPEAVAKYDEALRINPGYADAANNLASLYYSAKQYQKALDVLTRVEAKGATVNPELKKAISDALPKS